jgi:uncharacterized Zn-finger protein
MEDKSDLSSHTVYSTETENFEPEQNLIFCNKLSGVVKLETQYESLISTDTFSNNVTKILDRKIKTASIVHQNSDPDDYMTYVDAKHSIKCSTHCFKYEEGSIPAHNLRAGTSVFVKSEMPDESGVPTTQFPHHIADSQDCKVNTEVIVCHNKDCGDSITYHDVQHSAVSNIICFKHEYKYEEDSTHFIEQNVEEGTPAVVKSDMQDYSGMSTLDIPHNVSIFLDSEIKSESIVHPNQDCDGNITHTDVKHSAEYHIKTEQMIHQNPDCGCITNDNVQHSVESNIICFKHEYKHEGDSTPVMSHTVSGTVCTTAINKQHTCDTCTKSFPSKSQLISHIRVHTGDKPYKCDTCGKSFTEKSNLTRHMKIHTDDKPFSCDTCGKTFIQNGDLIKHVRVHTGEKPYKCDICSKSYASKNALAVHMKIHSGDKPYSCEMCTISFTVKQTLVRHMKIHNEDKPFSCDTCRKTFIQNGDLVSHVRVHTGDKQYKCYTCRRSFAKKSNLVVHMKIHIDDKPFSCDTCGKTFIQKCHLVNHIKVHTDDKPAG